MTVGAWSSTPEAAHSSRQRALRGLLLGVVAVLILRLLWYFSVAVVGCPFIPARDDQAGRQHIVDEIRSGSLVAPDFVGSRTVQLPLLDADLAVGGEVEVVRDAHGVLTVTFWTQSGVLGELAGYAFQSEGQVPTAMSDPDVTAQPLGGGWFALSG